MSIEQLGINYHSILPEIITALTGVVIMLVDALSRSRRRVFSATIALIGTTASATAVISLWGRPVAPSFAQMIVTDTFRLSFALIFLIVTALTILISLSWFEEEQLASDEFFALLMFATTGMLLMSAANDLVMIFLSLEIVSITTYVLAGYRRSDPRSNESSVKYFILGSFSTAFLLYGMALIYGAVVGAKSNRALAGYANASATNLGFIKDAITNNAVFSIDLIYVGAAMMLIGFGFKIASAPFHIWTPDVYQGAPTPVTAFMSAGPKAAAFAAFLRVFVITFASTASDELYQTWTGALLVMAVLTMTVGNIVAIVQSNIKRMLAYSSIAHAGYTLVGFIANDISSVVFYMLTYSLMTIGSFAVVWVMAQRGDERTEIADYSGIGFKSFGLSIMLSVFLLSLAGIPMTAGFMGKFLVFTSAWNAGYYGLVIIGVINSAISIYYYLRVIVVMFFREPEEGFVPPRIPYAAGVALGIAILGTFYLGLLPGRVLELIEAARNIAAIR